MGRWPDWEGAAPPSCANPAVNDMELSAPAVSIFMFIDFFEILNFEF
jgi:hypothetical protein